MLTQIALAPGQMTNQDTQAVVAKIQDLAAALQIQVSKHFAPIWQVDAAIAAYSDIRSVPVGYWPIMIVDVINDPNDLGYHIDDSNQPYAVVQFTTDDSWMMTASHELLEMLADPWGNRVVPGPSIDPDAPNDQVRYLVEVCDPVESNAFAYSINGMQVSNFITPAYHNPALQPGATPDRYDYCSVVKQPRQVLAGGYLSWEDLTTGKMRQVTVDEKGTPTFSDIGTGTFKGCKSLREAINKLTPTPASFYRPDQGIAPGLKARQDGVQRAALARANNLLQLIK